MNDYGLRLPEFWAYVIYADGTELNVANTDTLEKWEAEWYKEMWKSKGKVVAVELRTAKDDLVTRYNFEED